MSAWLCIVPITTLSPRLPGICLSVCPSACLSVYMYVCFIDAESVQVNKELKKIMHACMYACMSVCVYVCMHVYLLCMFKRVLVLIAVYLR